METNDTGTAKVLKVEAMANENYVKVLSNVYDLTIEARKWAYTPVLTKDENLTPEQRTHLAELSDKLSDVINAAERLIYNEVMRGEQ